MYGTGNRFGHKYLADKNLILVTINYRLGILGIPLYVNYIYFFKRYKWYEQIFLGFLSTQDHVVSGNRGMKDQVMALRWVNQHIGRFDGDSKKITLVGFSAGSSSIQYHYLSPMSRGLFHGSVGWSGTAVNPWAYQTKPAEKAKKLVLYLIVQLITLSKWSAA